MGGSIELRANPPSPLLFLSGSCPERSSVRVGYSGGKHDAGTCGTKRTEKKITLAKKVLVLCFFISFTHLFFFLSRHADTLHLLSQSNLPERRMEVSFPRTRTAYAVALWLCVLLCLCVFSLLFSPLIFYFSVGLSLCDALYHDEKRGGVAAVYARRVAKWVPLLLSFSLVVHRTFFLLLSIRVLCFLGFVSRSDKPASLTLSSLSLVISFQLRCGSSVISLSHCTALGALDCFETVCPLRE